MSAMLLTFVRKKNQDSLRRCFIIYFELVFPWLKAKCASIRGIHSFMSLKCEKSYYIDATI